MKYSEHGEETPESAVDFTGALLMPGKPEKCQGNGEHEEFDCCCDECDWFLLCFPEYL